MILNVEVSHKEASMYAPDILRNLALFSSNNEINKSLLHK